MLTYFDTYSLLHHVWNILSMLFGAWLKVFSGLQASGFQFYKILKETSIPNFLCLMYSRNRSAFKYKWQDNRTEVFFAMNIILSFCTTELKMPHFMLMVGLLLEFFILLQLKHVTKWSLTEEMKGIRKHEIHRN